MDELTTEQYTELMKCKEDIIYFAEKYISLDCRLYGALQDPKPNQLHNNQKETLKLWQNCKAHTTINARQTGTTALSCILLLHELIFQHEKKLMLLVANENTRKHYRELIMRMIESLPHFFFSILLTSDHDIGINSSTLSIHSFNENVVRGRGINTCIVDNIDYIWDDYGARFKDFKYSVFPMLMSSQKNKIIFTGTPKPENSRLLELYNTENPKWTKNKLPWDSVPGRDQKWLDNMKKSSGKYFKSEILLEYD